MRRRFIKMWEQELAAMIKAAKDAEVEIKKIYQTAFKVEIKADKSPVTLADKTADALIRKELGEAFPDYGMLTEESKDTKDRLSKENIWIVDPVDGTKEFVAHNGEFTTNIALAHNHQAVVGVINIPMRGVTYYAIKGQGAFRLEKDGTRTPIHDLFPEVQDSVHLLELQRHLRRRRCFDSRIRPQFPGLYGPEHQDSGIPGSDDGKLRDRFDVDGVLRRAVDEPLLR